MWHPLAFGWGSISIWALVIESSAYVFSNLWAIWLDSSSCYYTKRKALILFWSWETIQNSLAAGQSLLVPYGSFDCSEVDRLSSTIQVAYPRKSPVFRDRRLPQGRYNWIKELNRGLGRIISQHDSASNEAEEERFSSLSYSKPPDPSDDKEGLRRMVELAEKAREDPELLSASFIYQR